MSNSSNESIAKLAYSEINLGRVLGTGGFSTVSIVKSIDLDELYDDHGKDLRRALQRSLQSTQTQQPRPYVLKTLRHDLPDEDASKGVTDLALETELLLALNHPHIIQLRGMAVTDPHQPRFFILLDQLSQTLEIRLNYWRKVVGENNGVLWLPYYGYCCSNNSKLHDNWKERLQCASEIASALEYLHQQNIIYRDLKPDNIGFDAVSGTLKLFDFGLAKRLNHATKDDGNNFRLTGNTGSLRYMAPEVARDEPYNQSVDCYSFGILFWQICSLTTPYAGYNQQMHAQQVVQKGQRPTPDPSWPLSWTNVMTTAWSAQAPHRPTAQILVQELTNMLEYMSEQEGVVPTRASEIRAKKKRENVSQENHTTMDVDTRISGGNTTNNNNTPIQQHNSQIV